MNVYVLFSYKLTSMSDREFMMYLLSQIGELYGQCYRFNQLACLHWLIESKYYFKHI